MNGIIGFSEMMKNKDLTTEEKNTYINYIHDNSKQLLEILNNILEISTIGTQQIRLDNKTLNITALLNELYSHYEKELEKAGKKEIEFRLNLECKNSLTIKCDEKRLKQILMNLIDNSIKYTEKGFVKIGCKVINKNIRIIIEDSGIGIPENKLSVIFDKFIQLDYSATRKYGGTGIGLSIYQMLCKIMGGEIWVESELGKGSIFFVDLPYE